MTSFVDENSPLITGEGRSDTTARQRRSPFGTEVFALIIVVGLILSTRTSFLPGQLTPLLSTETPVSFPHNFTWGAATSAYQIEGATKLDGRGLSIWDIFCSKDPQNCNGDNADMACGHYFRIKEDVALMRELRLTAYRFSIAWPRILPDGKGRTNPAGVGFYNMLIDELIKNDIEPWVTLYHWDLPQGLESEYGGWLNRQIIDDFGNYADICFQVFGDRVKKWITINEPWTVAVHGYDEGSKAPGHSNHFATEPYIVGHNLLLAHARAVFIYKSKFAQKQDGIIGISNSGDFRWPLNPDKKGDVDAADRSMEWQLGWFADPIWKGDYPPSMRKLLGHRLPSFTPEERKLLSGSSDFLGLNHYSSLLASEPLLQASSSGEYWADMHVEFSDHPSWTKNCMGWNIAPEGGRELLLWIRDRYSNPTVYITENGSCENETNLESAVHDNGRRDYLEGYIRAFGEAVMKGVDLKGYFAWSLMDNFEWGFGYKPRFGIIRVNYETLERTPKLSANWYRDTIQANGRNLN